MTDLTENSGGRASPAETKLATQQTWQALVTAALLGSDRQAPLLPGNETSLGSLLQPLRTAGPEVTLLTTAAALSLYRLVGRQARITPATATQPAPTDHLPCCNHRASQTLACILNGPHGQLLPEWLAAVRAGGYRAPEEWLPYLLDLGRQQRELQNAIRPILGERGRWLAAQNPAWAYALPQDPAALWQTGPLTARGRLLNDLRETDPALALALLQETWSDEPATSRAQFLQAFAVNLSLTDEPFLESALDDRSRTVRRAAADLLARLPNSRLSRRMAARVRPLLTLTTAHQAPFSLSLPGLTRRQLQVSLPAACDPAMERDGVLPKPRVGLGEKVWWLLQMLAATPPQTWSEAWQLPPVDIITAAGRSQWELILLEGWITATGRYGQVEWAAALLNAAIARSTEISINDLEKLVAILPPTRREELVLQYLTAQRDPLRGDNPAILLLSLCHHPWSNHFSRLVLRKIENQTERRQDDTNWQLRALLREFGHHLDPQLAPEARRLLPAPDDPAWRRAIETFVTILNLRHEIYLATTTQTK